jgi:hypothetical protein
MPLECPPEHGEKRETCWSEPSAEIGPSWIWSAHCEHASDAFCNDQPIVAVRPRRRQGLMAGVPSNHNPALRGASWPNPARCAFLHAGHFLRVGKPGAVFGFAPDYALGYGIDDDARERARARKNGRRQATGSTRQAIDAISTENAVRQMPLSVGVAGMIGHREAHARRLDGFGCTEQNAPSQNVSPNPVPPIHRPRSIRTSRMREALW